MNDRDFLPSNIEKRDLMKEELGEIGLTILKSIWKRSCNTGNRFFKKESIRRCFDGTSPYGFVSDDFSLFPDYIAFGLRNEYYPLIENLTFTPLRAPIFNAGAPMVFRWITQFHLFIIRRMFEGVCNEHS